MDQFAFVGGGYLGARGLLWISSAGGNATGGLYQWFRLGPSYDTVLRKETKFSIRWGASPFYADKYIGNDKLKGINQWLRKKVEAIGIYGIRK